MRWLYSVLGAFYFLFLWGCHPTVDVRGYNPEDLTDSKVVVGQDTRESIQEKLGTPLMVSTFPPLPHQGEVWYYVSKKTSCKAFFKPETLDQRTLMIRFDEDGRVAERKLYVGEEIVEPIKNKTHVKGHEESFLKDVFGGFGRNLTQKSKPQT